MWEVVVVVGAADRHKWAPDCATATHDATTTHEVQHMRNAWQHMRTPIGFLSVDPNHPPSLFCTASA